jgi:protein-L-isoaspartate(D-aspartate) O-methyltransferase
MNIEQARFNMIEQQIRPWEVLDQTVLDLLAVVKREEFVPAAYRSLAFVDTEIPLTVNGKETGESMLAPKLEARLLQELAVKSTDVVLEIGTGSGYMAALLAYKAQRVTTVEILPELKALAESNLAAAGVRNVKVELGDGAAGWSAAGEADVIVVSGSTPVLADGLLQQLKAGGRLAVIVGDAPVMSAQIITRVSATALETVKLFETCVQPLRNAPQPARFKF